MANLINQFTGKGFNPLQSSRDPAGVLGMISRSRPSSTSKSSPTRRSSSRGVIRSAPVVDPLARVRAGFASQKENIYGTARDAAANAGIGLKGSILDFIDSLKSGQSKIDEMGIQNELAKRVGTRGVLGMVGRGIRSGGVTLANKNAGDSSAGERIANAYGDIGRRELSDIGNQYELGNREVVTAQQDLDRQKNSGIRRIKDSKVQIINNILAEARNKFAALDAAMLDADLPERINIEREKAKVKEQILGRLQQFDSLLTKEASKVKATSSGTRQAEAFKLANAGTAPENAFQFTEQVPAEFQDTGPFASELPIFTLPKPKTQEG